MTRDKDDILSKSLDALPRSVEPERDLWPGIDREIRGGRVTKVDFGRRRRELIGVAAAIALFAVALSTGVIRLGGSPEEAAAPDPLDLEYAAASSEILDRLDGGGLDPETVTVIRRNLDIIDDAVREIRRALDEEPTNARLNHLLTAEYQRRSALLRRAAELTEIERSAT